MNKINPKLQISREEMQHYGYAVLDAITGGFNFQNASRTGEFIVAQAITS